MEAIKLYFNEVDKKLTEYHGKEDCVFDFSNIDVTEKTDIGILNLVGCTNTSYQYDIDIARLHMISKDIQDGVSNQFTKVVYERNIQDSETLLNLFSVPPIDCEIPRKSLSLIESEISKSNNINAYVNLIARSLDSHLYCSFCTISEISKKGYSTRWIEKDILEYTSDIIMLFAIIEIDITKHLNNKSDFAKIGGNYDRMQAEEFKKIKTSSLKQNSSLDTLLIGCNKELLKGKLKPLVSGKRGYDIAIVIGALKALEYTVSSTRDLCNAFNSEMGAEAKERGVSTGLRLIKEGGTKSASGEAECLYQKMLSIKQELNNG